MLSTRELAGGLMIADYWFCLDGGLMVRSRVGMKKRAVGRHARSRRGWWRGRVCGTRVAGGHRLEVVGLACCVGRAQLFQYFP